MLGPPRAQHHRDPASRRVEAEHLVLVAKNETGPIPTCDCDSIAAHPQRPAALAVTHCCCCCDIAIACRRAQRARSLFLSTSIIIPCLKPGLVKATERTPFSFLFAPDVRQWLSGKMPHVMWRRRVSQAPWSSPSPILSTA